MRNNNIRWTPLAVGLALAVATVSVAGWGLAAESGQEPHGADAAHAAAGHGDEHGEGVGAHEFNWFYGFLGEDAELEHPTVLYRTPGMPVPFGAYLINTAILFYLLFKMGKGPLIEGLKKRRERIMLGMDQAAQMKAEATGQLAQYQGQLDSVDAEIVRIKADMAEAAQQEREVILQEAKVRQERMRRDAQKLLEQELKATQEALVQEMAVGAAESARALLVEQVTAADHQRVSDEYLGQLDAVLVTLGARS